MVEIGLANSLMHRTVIRKEETDQQMGYVATRPEDFTMTSRFTRQIHASAFVCAPER